MNLDTCDFTRIRTLRLERNWTQEQLSYWSGTTVRTISYIESGKKPRKGTFKHLAAGFGLSEEEFYKRLSWYNQLTLDLTS